MKIEVEAAEGCTIVRCDGVLDISSRDAIDEVLHPMIEHHSARVLLDLAGVSRITSEGISLLVTLVSRANSKGSRVVFVRPTPFVQAVFDTTKINRFLETEETLDAGVRRLRQPASDAAT